MSHVIERPGGSVTVTDAALQQVVAGADRPRAGRAGRAGAAGVEIEVKAGRARVELELRAPIGAVLPELAARRAGERDRRRSPAMCGLVVDAVDVTVGELVA